MTFDIVNLIEAKIQLDWSPEQVSGWLAKEEGIRISHERIYQGYVCVNCCFVLYL